MSALQAALQGHLKALGTMGCETLRYPNAPSVTTVEPLCEAVRAAEEEREQLLAALEYVAGWNVDGWSAEEARELIRAALARARGEAAEVPT